MTWLEWIQSNSNEIVQVFLQHVLLTLIPVVLGLVLSIPLGWLARHYRWLYPPMIGVTGLLYTVPSLALFVISPVIFGFRILDNANVIAALTVYSVALLVRTVADGLSAVPEDVRQAAQAMGYRPFRQFVSVELPVAVPFIAAGVRVAVVSNVSMVSVASLIGVSQLGSLFIDGFQRDFAAPLVTGLVLSVGLALALDAIVLFGTRVLTPWRRALRA
jgi:osmoprotectant transport system permease protein